MTLYKDLDMDTLCCGSKQPYSEVLFYTEILYRAGRIYGQKRGAGLALGKGLTHMVNYIQPDPPCDLPQCQP